MRADARLRFEIEANERIASIQRELDTKVEVVHSLRALFDASREVERAEFGTFVAPALHRHSSLKVAQWIQRVPEEQRTDFEAASRRELGPTFLIWERAADGRPAPAAPRPIHDVMVFAEPKSEHASALGFDSAGDLRRAALLTRAEARADATLSPPLPLVADPQQSSIMIVEPVHERSLGALAPGPGRPRGFVAAAFDVRGLLDEALDDLLADVIVRAYDAGESPPGAPSPPFLLAASIDAGIATPDPTRHFYSGFVDAGGRQWRIDCAPAPGAFVAARSWSPWIVLVSGLLVTGLLATSIITAAGKKAVERLAEGRARELAAEAAQRQAAEKSLGVVEERFRLLIEGVRDYAIFMLDPDGRVVSWNEAAQRTTGYTERDILGRHVSCFFPRDSADRGDADALLKAAAATGRAEAEGWQLRKDDTRYWAAGVISALRDDAGALRGFAVVTRDNTERRRAEERQQLMMRELDHRVKNNMAAVLAIVDHTAGGARTLEEFQRAFRGRIRALARLHAMLAQSSWSGADLRSLVRQTIEPYTESGDGRVIIKGDTLTLPARAVSSVTMALHELATNAAKYGALSAPEGRVEITWTTEKSPEGQALLRLTWVEGGGPPVQQPSHRGFGRDLIEVGVPFEVAGRANLEFAADGVRCELLVPLQRE